MFSEDQQFLRHRDRSQDGLRRDDRCRERRMSDDLAGTDNKLN